MKTKEEILEALKDNEILLERIETPDYVLWVSEKEPKDGDWGAMMREEGYVLLKNEHGNKKTMFANKFPSYKIIAHNPKGDAKELDLPLLPETKNDVEKLADNIANNNYGGGQSPSYYVGFQDGYKAATKVYSEEDLREAFEYGKQFSVEDFGSKYFEEFIQSLKQPKTPTHFSLERKEKSETMANPKLKLRYESSCNAYIDVFCQKQEMDFNGWIGDEVGGIAECNDFYFDFHAIVKDIDTAQPKGLIIDWYYDNLEAERFINYDSYIRGLRVSDLPVEDVEELAFEATIDYKPFVITCDNYRDYAMYGWVEGYKAAPALKAKAIYHRLMKESEEVISSPIRFTGVSIEKIKRVFEKYFDPYQFDF